MKSNRSLRASWGLLLVLLVLALVFLYLTERSYAAFREALQQIQLGLRLTSYQEEDSLRARARLHFTVTVKMPEVGMPAWLELIDWYLKSADGSVHLGFYTMGEKQLELVPGGTLEVSLEAVVEGYNFENLQKLIEAADGPTQLLFQGMTRVMFRLPRDEVREKIPLTSVFELRE